MIVINPTTPAPVRLIGLLLFGPNGRRLRDEVRNRVPWLDDATGDAFLLFALGDPKGSGDQYWAMMKAIGIERNDLVKSWNAMVRARGSEDVAEAFETFHAAEHFGLGLSNLPVMLVFVIDDPEPVAVALPRDEQLGDHGAQCVCEVLMDHLDPNTLRGISSPDSPPTRDALRAHVADLSKAIRACERRDEDENARRRALAIACAAGTTSTRELAQRMSERSDGLSETAARSWLQRRDPIHKATGDPALWREIEAARARNR